MFEIAGKEVKIQHVDGPVGVHARNHSSDRIRALGWTDRHTLRDGLGKTYPWVKEQTEQAIDTIRRNVDSLGFHDRSTIVRSDARSFVERQDERFDVALVDPPYSFDGWDDLLVVNGLMTTEDTGDL